MKISYNWIKNYLNIDLPAQKVAGILTDIGLEVEHAVLKQSIEGGLEGLLVGKVLSTTQHPNADRLKITSVDIGGDAPLPIVCGAPNVAEGQKVVVATVGTTLFPTDGESFSIKKSKIRGEVSIGMLCGEDEIGTGTSHDGIIVLDEKIAVGTPVSEVFEVETDYIFEIGLTPNRSDATCHTGVAKDLYAALVCNENFKGKIEMPDVSAFKVEKTGRPITLEVENAEDCPRYAGLCIENIEVKESPAWLKNRLEAIGVRPINNIVDITNFVLHELGQPLHAFDASAVKGDKIIVKKLPAGTKFVTLDEQERSLRADDLMICNAEEPMCIAGVFGGLHSGVSDKTTTIFLESACFEPTGIRKTAHGHVLFTDAAMRFEKGTDQNVAVTALKRAALLIQELAGGTVASDIVDFYPEEKKKAEVTVRFKQVSRLAGTNITAEKIKTILAALEMKTIAETEESITVAVPTNKVDVLREIDIIEEILRIFGFNNIPVPTSVKGTLVNQKGVNRHAFQNLAADFLSSRGLSEIMANSLSNSQFYAEDDASIVPLLNSLTVELDILRPKMIFSGLQTVQHNLNRKNSDLRLFEFGRTYQKVGEKIKENEYLSIFLTGNQAEENWQTATKSHDFYAMKKTVNDLLTRLGITNFETAAYSDEELAYGLGYQNRGAAEPFVKMGLVRPALLKKMKIKAGVFYAQINWTAIVKAQAKREIRYQPISKMPNMRRDLALVIDQSVSYADIETIARKTAKKLLRSVNLFDIFEDETKIGVGKKSYALSFVFGDDAKTLTDKEVDKTMQKMIKSLEQQLNAELR